MTHLRIFSSVLLLLAAMFFPPHAEAQIPEPINYQGYLTDAAGQGLNEAVGVTFSIYTAESGGTALWSETQIVVTEQGLFSAKLGDGAVPFPVGMFDTPLWIGIEIDADGEMTPRTALTSAPYAKRAADAQMLGGQMPSAFDQTAEVASASADAAAAQVSANQASAAAAGAQADVDAVQGSLGALDSSVSQLESDVAGVNADISGLESDLTGVQNTLPTLQNRVTGTCASGSSIRQVLQNGGVTCEVDDGSLWSTGSSNSVSYSGGNVGIGTTAPAAGIQIDAPAGTDPFRARVESATKLRVHSNGSVSVGTSSVGPENGLFVSGDARIGSVSLDARLSVTDMLWQAAFDNNDVGGDDWFLGSSADAWAIGGGKFVISTTNNSNSAALVIDSNRDVGIGVTDPQGRVHVSGGTDVTPTSGGFVILGSSSGSNIALDNNEIMARANGGVGPLAINAEGGEVRIATAGSRDDDALEVRGRVYFDNGGNGGMRITATDSNPTNALFESTQYEKGLVGGSVRPFWRMYSREFYAKSPLEYRTYSDRSLKDNVRLIPDALATIQAIDGVTYELNKHPMDTTDRVLSAEQEYDRTHQLGFIAQDIERVLPQLVRVDESTGLQSVGYMAVIPVLVEAMKEQQAQIEAQNARLERLEAQLESLR